MFGRSQQPDLNVLVLRDADVIAARVRWALDEASPEERPGLERAAALVEQAAAAEDADLFARWVHERLAAAGYEGAPDSVQAIKVLREAAPGLSLKSAVQLAKHAAAPSRR
ncbi:hypothetical protein FE633_19500 [Streptomyces montanus]|uniref:Uncharacterized protein n=1 Tax=Streptomyces montanus TaxID=2580423 RepID=A0A5R9FPF4_9ACTN|nr:hypothetical protein [Streptomyces montanus]TLS44499.1 hypothetical protein FE633_19500 [Streptomyces montanus]